MEILARMLKDVESVPEDQRDTMKYRDSMYELAVKAQSVDMTVPKSLMAHNEIEIVDRALALVDRYYNSASSLGVVV